MSRPLILAGAAAFTAGLLLPASGALLLAGLAIVGLGLYGLATATRGLL